MRKPAIAVAAVVLMVAGIVLPAGYFGQVAETILKNRMANLPYGLQMELADYQRGWFSSTGRLEWQPFASLPIPGMPAQGPVPGVSPMNLPPAAQKLLLEPIGIDIEIAHGPVFFAVGPGVGLFHARGQIEFADPASAGEEDASDNALELYVSSFTGATVSNRLEIPTAELEAESVALNLAGALLKGEWTGPDSFQLQSLALESLDMTAGAAESGVRIALSDLKSSAEYPQGFPSGAILARSETASSIGEFLVEQAEGDTIFRMVGLNAVDTASLEDGGTYRIESDATVESVELLGREFAPIEIRQTTGGLREESLLQLLTAAVEGIFETPPAPPAPEDSPQAPSESPPSDAVPSQTPPPEPAPFPTPEPAPPSMPQLSAEMKEALRAFLADGPYAEVSAELTYGGEHVIRLELAQAFDSERAPATAEMVNLPGLVSGLDYSLEAEIPIAAAQELIGPPFIQMGLMQGLLQQTETAYTLSLALRNGTLTINGRPMPIPLPPPAAPAAPPPPP